MSLLNSSTPQLHPDLQEEIERESQKYRFQQIVHNLTDKCWEVCMGKPSTSLNSATEKCFANCVERFLDTDTLALSKIKNLAVHINDYAKRVLKEAQEREVQEILERNKKYQHYEGTEEMCNKTAMTMVQTLSTAICSRLKADNIINPLKKGTSKKVQLWEQLMVLSFTKVVVMVYASSLLMILLRVQLNLIGGYIFRDSSDGTKKLDRVSQEKYLSISNSMIDNGIQQLITLIKPKVKSVLKNKSLKLGMTVNDMEKIFWAIQSAVNTDVRDPCKNFTKYCMPMKIGKYPDSNNHKEDAFDKMIEETSDILESSEIERLTQSAILSGFALVMDELSDQFKTKFDTLRKSENNSKAVVASTSDAITPSSENEDDFIDRSAVTLPMARVIPLVHSLVPDVYRNNGFVDSLMFKLTLMEPLKVMGANVYETFSSNF